MFIIGHRGACAVFPENTITALKEGMKCADFVEIDIHLTKDGVPVVLHDATLDRTTDGSGPVDSMTLLKLREFDAGDGHPVPTLQEVCDLCLPSCGIVTEIKEPGSEEAVCAILGNYDPVSLWIVSFHPESVRKVKRLLPSVKAGLICSTDCSDPFSPVRDAGADAILPRTDRVSSEMVREAHQQGLSVIVWTLNAPDAYRRARSSCADGWVTDDPCGLRAWLTHVEE
ncbi:glycerophosphodiester phosphodiesterase [Methanogenium organophilum]|uniref:Glycerophosphodiester phosphodiesterase family protein n=1 Tax=Methanogenium organophilum TaxID=2199 RepID=A0A9X9S4Q5_METOG|nr:glycerophosphodiester phosphodiesterase family protein [Methanogenium organophilum]WAI01697.1 glycerophosphodiester phosphodiesterase family protein [Methanogenium organophilum]